MASWLQNRLRAAEELLESVDRQAKSAAVPRYDSPRGEMETAADPKSHVPRAKVVAELQTSVIFDEIHLKL